MKKKLKRTNSNKPICSKNNNEHVGAERIGTRPIPTMPAHNKGITLIALIITIVVLLVLAAVAIAAVKGDGIISHAKNAKSQYSEAQTNEQELLSNYELMLAEETGNEWKQEKTKVTKGNTTLNVGDIITNFTAGGKTWKVLGAENGKLLLTTTENVNDSFTLKGSTAGWSEAEKRFVAAEKALDDECKSKIALTEEEKKQVAELRSMKVEDINRVTGYNPAATGDGKPCYSENIYQYGNEVTYSVVKDGSGTVTGVKYESKNVADKSDTSADRTKFWAPNTSTNITSPYTVRSTSYSYYPYSLTTSSSTTGECKGITKDSPAYILLFRDAANTKNVNYWLASSFVSAGGGNAFFGLRIVYNGSVNCNYLWYSSRGGNSYTCGVRPVVSLASDFQPAK